VHWVRNADAITPRTTVESIQRGSGFEPDPFEMDVDLCMAILSSSLKSLGSYLTRRHRVSTSLGDLQRPRVRRPREPMYRLVAIVAWIARALGRWKVIVSGIENVPDSGPVVLAINHSGYLDPIFAAWPVVFEKKRWVRYLAKKEVFDHKLSGPLMRGMKHIAVDRRRAPLKALTASIQALNTGEVVGTFPEATINRSFVPGKGKSGTVRMAQASGATVVPVAVWGAHRLLTKGHPPNIQSGVAIYINFGKRMHFDPEENPKQATERLMAEIRSLLAETQAKYPQQPASYDDRWWLPAHLGGTAPAPEEVLPRANEPGLS
jgi:1-acyl-sn-glycerol-3-phosphate acyltransferase